MRAQLGLRKDGVRGALTIERQLHVASPKDLSDLEELLGKDLAWRLLGAGLVGVDLEKVIEPQSQIFLTGGHRHADLLA